MAKCSPQGAAQDADFLGTGRHILHPRGRRGVPERPSEGGNASARVWSFRCRRLSRPNRGEYASLLRRAGCSQSSEEGLAKAVVVGFDRNWQAVWRDWVTHYESGVVELRNAHLTGEIAKALGREPANYLRFLRRWKEWRSSQTHP